MDTPVELAERLREHLSGPYTNLYIEEIIRQGLDVLPVLGEFLRRDLPIAQTERLEALLKGVLLERVPEARIGT